MKPEPGTQPSMSENATPLTLADGPAEARRLIALAQIKGDILRLLGGVAIQLRCPHAAHRALNRTYADLDFVAHKKQARSVGALLVVSGYTADRRFNALHGERRLLFFDEARSRQVDIFLGAFEMCHTLPLDQRLALHPLTLSPADLLLSKLQIVQLNAKDIQDILALLLDFPPMESTPRPGDDLDVSVIADLCRRDWGWFITLKDNLDRIASAATEILAPEEATIIVQRVDMVKQAVSKAPKSVGWRLRAAVGRRMPWYELPEEVQR